MVCSVVMTNLEKCIFRDISAVLKIFKTMVCSIAGGHRCRVKVTEGWATSNQEIEYDLVESHKRVVFILIRLQHMNVNVRESM